MSPLVVVLDEDESVFDELGKGLEDAGYLVLPLSTTAGIVDELKETQAAALLLDLQTDGSSSSAEVLTHLEHDADFAALPVLAYSTDPAQLAALQPRLLARGYGILHKPFQLDEVLRWLHERVG